MVKEVSYGYRNPKNPRPRQTKVALVLGRFQPLHIGHKTLMTASRLPVVIGLVRGKNSDPLKNPLSEELQREVISEVAASNVVHTEVFANAALDVILDKLRDSGFELTEVYCGSDRFDSYKKQAALYPPLMNGHVTEGDAGTEAVHFRQDAGQHRLMSAALLLPTTSAILLS